MRLLSSIILSFLDTKINTKAKNDPDITFKNKYDARLRLPDTGGSGLKPATVGIALMILTGTAYLATLIKKKKTPRRQSH
jgi:hypothetical protein